MEQVLRKHGIKILLFTLVVAVLILLVTQWLNQQQTDLTDEFPLNEKAPEFELTHVNGDKVSLADTEGQVRLIYFYFSTCPDVCPPTTYFLSQVQEKLKEEGVFGEKASIYSITFDPARDTTERLLEFSGNYEADLSAWYFLRGDEQATRQLAKDYGILVNEEPDGTFSHTNVIFLIDQDGNIRKYYSGNSESTTADDIMEDINKLL